MASLSFHAEYSPSYFGSVNIDVRLRFDENYNSGTNKTTLSLQGIDFRMNGNTATYPDLPIYGAISVAGTQIVEIDNESQVATVGISGADWCSANLSGLSPSQVTVTHNADGSKSVDVSLTGGFTSSQTRFAAVYTWQRQIGTDPGTGHPIYTTTYVPFGIETPATATMALTTHTPTYTVSYNANGGSGAPSSQTKTYGVNLTLSSTKPTRSSSSPGSYTVSYNINYTGGTNPSSSSSTRTRAYTFSKWNTKSDGTGTNYNSGGTYSANAAATLYAQWSYTETRSAVTLPSPSRTGHTFDGWYTASSGGTKVGGAGASYTPSGNITLYAHWTINTYTVSYNKGSYGTGTNTTATKTYDVALTLKGAIFTRTGYTQDGWSTTDGGSKTYNLSASYTTNAAVTLYPHWAVNSYTLSLTKGDYIASVSGGGSKNYGASVTVTATLSSATGYTYSFDGWYQGTAKKSSSLSYTFDMPAGDLSLTAKGKRVRNTYTLTLDPGLYSTITVKRNGVTLADGATITYGDVLTVSYVAQTGYYASTHTINDNTFTSGDTYTVDGNVTVKVRCLVSSYTLSLTAGTYVSSVSGGGSKNYNASVTVSAVLGSATGYTYSFDGWYQGTTKKSSSQSYTFNMPAGDLSLTAKATRALNTYTISYNKGSYGSGTNTTDTKTYGVALTLKGAIFTRTGYTQDGWSTSDGGSKAYDLGGSYTANSATTLYPHWRANTYTLTISQGSGSTISVKRGSTTLPSGSSITYDETLTISISANTGYNIGTHTVNGSTFTSGSYTVKGNTSVVSTATKKTYTLTIAHGTKSSAVVNRTSSPIGGAATGNLESGATLYHNDVLKVTFSSQTGYHVTTHTVNGSTFTSGNSHTVTAAVSVACYSGANNYTVKFNANKGTATSHGSMSDQSFVYDTAQNLTANAFRRSYDLTYYIDGLGITYAVDSTFNGWATSASGSVAYQDAASVKNLTSTNNGTVNLYAKWTNGTTSLPNIPAKRGYTIKGWYTAASGGTKVGNAGDSYTPTANTTIYAQYAKNTYKLSITKSNPGVTLTVHRDSSPIGGGSIANLSNNATLYVDDQLTITYSITAGYTQDVATVNGVAFTSPKTISAVDGNVAVVVTVKMSGTVWIYDGSEDNNGWGLYQVYIYDNDGWSLYQPYIYDGDGWSLY